MAAAIRPGVVEHAIGLAAASVAGQWERVRGDFDDTAGDFTVVQVPLQFEAGNCLLTVSYGAEDRVAGLFVKPTR